MTIKDLGNNMIFEQNIKCVNYTQVWANNVPGTWISEHKGPEQEHPNCAGEIARKFKMWLD